jgi:hypothetical protein
MHNHVYLCIIIPFIVGFAMFHGIAMEIAMICPTIMYNHVLVGGIPTPLKNISQWEG